ncbi:guanylate kinase [Paenibacillus koleovorans]|uniref:guanylate kinase n=1 Tax=Paenibacillus koleovorans TaxID=121608 RepID=UPI000FD98B64|nr:guanylate kinase [Paenibacillus koleovorans]
MTGLTSKSRIFVFTGPDGSGRKTVADMVGTTLELRKVLSCTTRGKRPGEVEGQDYQFISVEEFQEAEQAGQFIESVTINGNHYGIRQSDLDQLLAADDFIYLILNHDGASILRRVYGDLVTELFLYADRDSVLQRQRDRGDSEDVIRNHMSHYDDAMAYQSQCDFVFENLDLAHTVFAITNYLEPYLDRQLLNLD